MEQSFFDGSAPPAPKVGSADKLQGAEHRDRDPGMSLKGFELTPMSFLAVVSALAHNPHASKEQSA